MAKVKIYNLDGKSVGEEELQADIFEITPKSEVVHQVVVAQQANSRETLAHTKIRSEVQGGGKKPHKQKGTGRARAGSIRSPLWKGGGVTFGPSKDRNFSKKINKKVKNKALRMVLSDKVKNEKLILVEKLELTEGKTKNLKELLAKLPCQDKKSLLSLAKKQDNIVKASQNLPQVFSCAANSLNVVDLLRYEYVVLDKDALKKIQEIYKPKTK